ncbi:MAG: hypothetical protein WDN45_05985 [Caulobacteraceae bacterium]
MADGVFIHEDGMRRPDALRHQPLIPPGVMPQLVRVVVSGAIDLHREASFGTIEVEDIRPDGMLPPEAEPPS